MTDKSPRLTPQTLKVLDLLIGEAGLSGAEIARRTRLLSGTLYPLLLRLEEAGWLASHWEAGDPSELGRPRRRFYEMTNAGRAGLRNAAAEQAALFGRLATVPG